MNEKRAIALGLIVALTGVCFLLARAIVSEVLPIPTVEIEQVELTAPAPAPSKVETLPSLLELTAMPEITYSLPGDSNHFTQTCSDFEVLPTRDRTMFVLDAAEGSGIDPLNPCVRNLATKAGDLVVGLCQGGTPLSRAFDRAVAYFQVECDPRVPQWDLEPATPHSEFLGDLF